MVNQPTPMNTSLQTLCDLQTALYSLLARTNRAFNHPYQLSNHCDQPSTDYKTVYKNSEHTSGHQNRTYNHQNRTFSDQNRTFSHQTRTPSHQNRTSSHQKSSSSHQKRTSRHQNRTSHHQIRPSNSSYQDRISSHQSRTFSGRYLSPKKENTSKPCNWSIHQQSSSMEEQLRITREGSVCRARSQGNDVMNLPEDIRDKLAKPTCSNKDDKGLINPGGTDLNHGTRHSAPNFRQTLTQPSQKFSDGRTSDLPSQSNSEKLLARKAKNEYLIISKMVEMKPKIVDDHDKWTKHMRFFQVSCFEFTVSIW